MVDETVRIEQMTLRVPGLRAEKVQRFGREVAERLAQGVVSGAAARFLGAVRLEVTVGMDGSDRRALAERVAQRILKGVG